MMIMLLSTTNNNNRKPIAPLWGLFGTGAVGR